MDRARLDYLIGLGYSQNQIAEACGCSQTTVRYWLKKHQLRTVHARYNALNSAVSLSNLRSQTAAVAVQEACFRHGITEFVWRQSDRRYRCKRCDSDRAGKRIARKRLAAKTAIVNGRGNQCSHCQRTGPTTIFDFHHVDSNKEKTVSAWSRIGNWQKFHEEAEKCLLMCANCHRLLHQQNVEDLSPTSKISRLIKTALIEWNGEKCQSCKSQFDVSVYDFHHVNPSSKKANLGILIARRSYLEIAAEAPKCVLVCACCHREIEAKIRASPAPQSAATEQACLRHLANKVPQSRVLRQAVKNVNPLDA
jgi:predicted transcriptional regulator